MLSTSTTSSGKMPRHHHSPSIPPWPTPQLARAISMVSPRCWNDSKIMLDCTALDILERISHGDLSAEAVTASHLDKIRQTDGRVRAFLHVDEEGALAAARAVDAKRERGEKTGLLA